MKKQKYEEAERVFNRFFPDKKLAWENGNEWYHIRRYRFLDKEGNETPYNLEESTIKCQCGCNQLDFHTEISKGGDIILSKMDIAELNRTRTKSYFVDEDFWTTFESSLDELLKLNLAST